MIWLTSFIALVVLLVIIFAGWRAVDRRADRLAWSFLVKTGAGGTQAFDPAMVADLPEPARRYFCFTILPGTPLHCVSEITMTGELGLGTIEKPKYQPMQAHQLLAPPYGLVWKLKTGVISGSDALLPDTSWTRFWLCGLFPVVRAGGADHQRSAFGRVVAEAVFWAPASLLPSEHVRWQALDENRARVIVRYGQFEQAADITVDASGAPRRVVIPRWSNENPEKTFREQPFGGDMSDFREFAGFRLPTRIEGGNHIGTAQYFPFFRAEVKEFRFPGG